MGLRFKDRQPGPYSQLPPEEQEDVLSAALRMGTGTLGWLGNLLDTPGAMIRGGIHDITQGQLPLHALTSLWDWDNRISGRQQLEDWGLAGENDQGWMPDMGDIAGFGYELATDPLTYLGGFGALTQSGKSAPKLAGGLARQVGAGQRALAKFSVPGLGTLAEWTGKSAVPLASALEKGYKAARYGTLSDLNKYLPARLQTTSRFSPISQLAKLFSNQHNVGDPLFQQALVEGLSSVDNLTPGSAASATKASNPLAQGYDTALDKSTLANNRMAEDWKMRLARTGATPEQVTLWSRVARGLAERPQFYDTLEPLLDPTTLRPTGQSQRSFAWVDNELNALKQVNPELGSLAEEFGQFSRNEREAMKRRGDALDIPVGDELAPGGYERLHRQFPGLPGESASFARQEHLDRILGGTGRTNDFITGLYKLRQQKGAVTPEDVMWMMGMIRKDSGNWQRLMNVINDPGLTKWKSVQEAEGYLRKALDPGQKELELLGATAIPTDDQELLFKLFGDPRTPNSIGEIHTINQAPTLDDFRKGLMGFMDTHGQAPVVHAGNLGRADFQEMALAISNNVNKYTPEQLTVGFGRNAITDFFTGRMALETKILKAKFLQEFAAKLAFHPAGGVASALPGGDVTRVGDLLKEIGLNPDRMGEGKFQSSQFIAGMGASGKRPSMLNKDAWAALSGEFAQRGMGGAQTQDVLAGMNLPTWFVREAKRFWNEASDENLVVGTLKALDPLMNLFKGWTLGMPTRFVRDAMEGTSMLWAAGHLNPQAAGDAWTVLQGGTKLAKMPEMLKNPQFLKRSQDIAVKYGHPVPTEEDALWALRQIVGESELISGRQGVYGTGNLTGAMQGHDPSLAMDPLTEILGFDPLTRERVMGQGSTWNPLAVRGMPENWRKQTVLPRTENKFLAGAENVGHKVDQFLRIEPLIDMIAKGYDIDEAVKRVRALSVDYRPETFSTFERDYLKRLFPFYSFARRMTPQVVGMLAQDPGGPIGKLARIARLQDDSQSPDTHLQDRFTGINLPLGETTVATKVPTPIDQLAFRGGVQGTLESVLSSLRPELKTPLEIGAGKSFYFDKPLDEVYKGPTDNATLNYLLENNPFQRPLRAVGKTLNGQPLEALRSVTLPIDVEDTAVNAKMNREQDALRQIMDVLEAQPRDLIRRRVDFAPVPEKVGQLDPAILQLLRAKQTISQQRSAERKKREQAGL